MLSITRAEGAIEVAFGETRRLSVAVDEIATAMLSAERAPCGRLRHVLTLDGGGRWSPILLEASLDELTLIHQYVIESMTTACQPLH